MPASPCIGLCQIDDRSGLCLGCARTSAEIAIWGQAREAERLHIWAQLAARRAQWGFAFHKLAWTVADIRSFILDTLQSRRGTWVSGVQGAVGEFCISAEEPCEIDSAKGRLSAKTPRGAISFHVPEPLCAIAFGPPADFVQSGIIVLALPRTHATLSADRGLTRVGVDTEAVCDRDNHEILYDFGLGRIAAHFGIRTSRLDLISRLDQHLGLEWQQFLAAIGADLMRMPPTRILRNCIGRIEIFTEIPKPGDPTVCGPHTHFLPDRLAPGGDLPAGMQIPPGYIPCAIHYPARHD